MIDEATIDVIYNDLRRLSRGDEDAVQVAVFRTWHRVLPPDDPIMFARKVLWNVLIEHARNRGVRAKRQSQIIAAETEWSAPPRADRIAIAKESLSRVDPRLVAYVLGKGPKTSTLSRLRKQARKAIG